eukprot:TRINITY_DN17246_c0_g1_i6.p1 TRINITY_DN17246_c0_g1~~TRINITY_DN17246_c0_g1_i6.p1  ORF type:complete len:326 (+),score=19.85 TRINITY_DN17246_c0_g1_i6:189-1166(+)
MKRKANVMTLTESQEQEVSTRRSWSKVEDILLSRLVVMHKGKKKWKLVAETIAKIYQGNRKPKTPKQCRERWHTYLNPAIVAAPWTSDEQRILFAAHKIHGSRWARIVKKLPGRTDNGAKNYFFCRLRKLMRCIKSWVIEVNEKTDIEEVRQFAYLLNYLYTFYISPDRLRNLQQALHSRVRKKRNQGDKYIIDLIVEDPDISCNFSKFVELFLIQLRYDVLPIIIYEYPQFKPKLPIEYSIETNRSTADATSLKTDKGSSGAMTTDSKTIESALEKKLPSFYCEPPKMQNVELVKEFMPSFDFRAYTAAILGNTNFTRKLRKDN